MKILLNFPSEDSKDKSLKKTHKILDSNSKDDFLGSKPIILVMTPTSSNECQF